MTRTDDQKTLSERALKKKIDQEKDSASNHPPSDPTPGQGLHPIEREKPIDLDERTGG